MFRVKPHAIYIIELWPLHLISDVDSSPKVCDTRHTHNKIFDQSINIRHASCIIACPLLFLPWLPALLTLPGGRGRASGAACSAKCADTDTNAQCSNCGSAPDYERWEREGFRGPGSGGSAQAAHDYGTTGQYDLMKDQTAVCSILHALHRNDVTAGQPREFCCVCV